nr:hypothetical protein [uncultured Flavobacterium sp.]
MKAEITNQETISLNKIEKNVGQILEIIHNIRPVFLKQQLEFSAKANQEKAMLYKKMFPERVLGINRIQEDYIKILDDPNLSKLEKEDLDFILDLEKIGFRKSQYVNEMNVLAQKEEYFADSFFTFFIGESVYFNFLSSELRTIQNKLNVISCSKP